MSYQTPRSATVSSPDVLIAKIAARQHGTIRLEQLFWAGLSEAAIRRRVKSGRLHRLYKGVYAVGHTGLSYEGHVIASVFACGEPQRPA